MPRPYHVIDDTIDLDRIVVVTDIVKLPARTREDGTVSANMGFRFQVFLEGLSGGSRSFYLVDKASIDIWHRLLVEAWAGKDEERGDLDV